MNVRLNALHAQHARARVKSNGELHEVLQSEAPPRLRWWERYFKWEYNLTVAGRTLEKGWVIPQQLGVVLIGLIITGVVGMYWVMDARIDAKDNAYQEQRDMLIEIKTELKIQKEHDAEWKRKQVDDQEIQNLKIQDLKDRILVLKQ